MTFDQAFGAINNAGDGRLVLQHINNETCIMYHVTACSQNLGI